MKKLILLLTIALAIPVITAAAEPVTEGTPELKSCCAVSAQAEANAPCTMDTRIQVLLKKLEDQVSYEKLQAEIDAWEREINADYE